MAYVPSWIAKSDLLAIDYYGLQMDTYLVVPYPRISQQHELKARLTYLGILVLIKVAYEILVPMVAVVQLSVRLHYICKEMEDIVNTSCETVTGQPCLRNLSPKRSMYSRGVNFGFFRRPYTPPANKGASVLRDAATDQSPMASFPRPIRSLHRMPPLSDTDLGKRRAKQKITAKIQSAPLLVGASSPKARPSLDSLSLLPDSPIDLTPQAEQLDRNHRQSTTTTDSSPLPRPVDILQRRRGWIAGIPSPQGIDLVRQAITSTVFVNSDNDQHHPNTDDAIISTTLPGVETRHETRPRKDRESPSTSGGPETRSDDALHHSRGGWVLDTPSPPAGELLRRGVSSMNFADYEDHRETVPSTFDFPISAVQKQQRHESPSGSRSESPATRSEDSLHRHRGRWVTDTPSPLARDVVVRGDVSFVKFTDTLENNDFETVIRPASALRRYKNEKDEDQTSHTNTNMPTTTHHAMHHHMRRSSSSSLDIHALESNDFSHKLRRTRSVGRGSQQKPSKQHHYFSNSDSREVSFGSDALTDSSETFHSRRRSTLMVTDLEAFQPRTSFLTEITTINEALERMSRGLASFSKYVPTEIVRSLLEEGRHAALGFVERNITILFIDICNFTTISEHLTRKQLAAYLHQYLSVVCHTIRKYEGTVDKFLGDGVMAFFNAPKRVSNHPLRACQAAAAIVEELEAISDFLGREGVNTYNVRIGIHYGSRTLVGNCGCDFRMAYTAIGDDVNLAARLESLNKHYGSTIMISEALYDRVKQLVTCRVLDRVAVCGKSIPHYVYELLTIGSANEADNDLDQSLYQRYAHCLDHLLSGPKQVVHAYSELLDLSKSYPYDRPCQVLLERARAYLDNPLIYKDHFAPDFK
mmetsp:Transcript_20909/g.34454  ORF Transcript_20909/g.34454 Transcript_20909/m.34454 type:complete len:870 (-) Transcript_20909:331-2940(-)